MKDIDHLLRVAALFAIAVTCFVIGRTLLTAKSFGKYGHYRADAVDEIAALPVRYAGEAACQKCHAAQAKAKAKAGHRGISCESCHGALKAHAEDPKAAKAAKPKESEMRAFCGWCHEKSITKPVKFPQQDIRDHNPGIACSQCHPPHQPK